MLLTGCSLAAKTEIGNLDPKFSANPMKKLGIIKLDTYTMEPMSGGQAVASQFGLVGALVMVTAESLKNSGDTSIDELGVMLHKKSLQSLNERMGTTPKISFTDLKWSSDLDPVALSRYIRDMRLWGSKTPSDKEIADAFQNNLLDYVLYGKTWGGIYKNSGQLYFTTKWRIYDREGNEAVSVFTRSVEEKTESELSNADITLRLVNLFNQNLDRFFSVINR